MKFLMSFWTSLLSLVLPMRELLLLKLLLLALLRKLLVCIDLRTESAFTNMYILGDCTEF